MNTVNRPPLRPMLEARGLLAKKSLGQHFLLDQNVTDKIVRLAGIEPGQTVLEIGPGPGGLTRALLDAGAHPLIVIEKDTRFVEMLSELAEVHTGQLRIVEADALEIDETALLGENVQAHIVSNLPYNVGTPLLIKWLKAGPWRASMTLMFQEEVAERVVALPGSSAYGRLAVITRAICAPQIVMRLPARAFTPPPKVDSAVVHLTPLPVSERFDDLAALERVTEAAFGQRRKMLRGSLKQLGNANALLKTAGINPEKRPEELEPAAFFELARAWRAGAASVTSAL